MSPRSFILIFCLFLASAAGAASDNTHASGGNTPRHPITNQSLARSFEAFVGSLKGWDISLEQARRVWIATQNMITDGPDAQLSSARKIVDALGTGHVKDGEELATRILGLTGDDTKLAKALLVAAYDARVLADTQPEALLRRVARLKDDHTEGPERQAMVEESRRLRNHFGEYWDFYKNVGLDRDAAFGRWAQFRQDLEAARGHGDDASAALDRATTHAIQMWEGISQSQRAEAAQQIQALAAGDPSDPTLAMLNGVYKAMTAEGSDHGSPEELDKLVPGLSDSFARAYPKEHGRATSFRDLLNKAVVEVEPDQPEKGYRIGDKDAYQELRANYSQSLPWALQHGDTKLIFALANRSSDGSKVQVELRPQSGEDGTLFQVPNNVWGLRKLAGVVDENLDGTSYVAGPDEFPDYVDPDGSKLHVQEIAPPPKPKKIALPTQSDDDHNGGNGGGNDGAVVHAQSPATPNQSSGYQTPGPTTQNGVYELPRFWQPSPNQTLAGSCLQMAATGEAEYMMNQYCGIENPTPGGWVNQNGQNSYQAPRGFDLSERYLLNQISTQSFNYHRFTDEGMVLPWTKSFMFENEMGFDRDDSGSGLDFRPENLPSQPHSGMPSYSRRVLFWTPGTSNNANAQPGAATPAEWKVNSVIWALKTLKQPVMLTYNPPGYSWHTIMVVGVDMANHRFLIRDSSHGDARTDLPWYGYTDGSTLPRLDETWLPFDWVTNWATDAASYYLTEKPNPQSAFCQQVSH